MNFKEYVAFTDTVAQYPQTAEAFYLALGMSDEYGELNEKMLNNDGKSFEGCIDELGDLFWYALRYGSKVLNVNVELLEIGVSVKIGMIGVSLLNAKTQDALTAVITECSKSVVMVGKLCGYEKKKIRDGDTWSEYKKSTKFDEACANFRTLIEYLCTLALIFGVDHEEVLKRNAVKLGARLEHGTIKGDGDSR